MSNFFTLKELIELIEIDLGQVLIPIDAFGYTMEKLEKIFIESIKAYAQYYPYERTVPIQMTQQGTVLSDALEVQHVRHGYGNYVKSSPKVDSALYEFYPKTKVLRSEVNFNGLVTYLANYPIGYFEISGDEIPIYESEDELNFSVKSYFKKGSLLVELNEGAIPDSKVTFDSINDKIIVSQLTGQLLKTGHIVKFKQLNTLPSNIDTSTEYYLIKLSNTEFKLADTYNDAFANISIDILDDGIPDNFITHVKFYLKENLNTYDKIPSLFTVTSSILEVDPILVSKIEPGTTITISSIVGSTGITVNTTYYAIVLDENHIKLADTYENALLENALTITNGSGSLHHKYDEQDDETFVLLEGPLGIAELNINTLNGVFYNTLGFSGNFTTKFISKYKCVEGISLDQYDDFFILIFKQKFANGLGRQKLTVNLEGLPVNITADELAAYQAELDSTIKEYKDSRGSWWKFA